MPQWYWAATRNVEQLGAYIAWLINNRMFTDYVERTCEDAITNVRLQSTTGADFLATDLHGELKPSHLTDEGDRLRNTICCQSFTMRTMNLLSLMGRTNGFVTVTLRRSSPLRFESSSTRTRWRVLAS